MWARENSVAVGRCHPGCEGIGEGGVMGTERKGREEALWTAQPGRLPCEATWCLLFPSGWEEVPHRRGAGALRNPPTLRNGTWGLVVLEQMK